LVGRAVAQLTWLLVVASAALIAVGTVVSGAGRHAGDSSEVARIHIDWELIAQLHADLAWFVIALTVALWFVLKAVDAPERPLHRTRDLFLVVMAQGVIGYVQYFTHTPEILVGIHMLGATLVWIGVLRVLLAQREREPADSAESVTAVENEGAALTAV
jgi:cytochrome c oxidase assembly protein subunit 15